MPFDIPDSWEWVRLHTITYLQMGQSPKGDTVSEFDKGVEFHQGKVYFSDRIISKSNQKTTSPTRVAEPNSVLLCVRAPVGKVNITDREICIGRGLCAVKPLGGMCVDYIFHLLETYENIFIKKSTGTTFKAITGEVVKNQLVPLPPIEEQDRIVKIIKRVLPFIENYANIEIKINELNDMFPDQLKKSILQEAVMGKLVPQDESDEPASVLLERIREEKQRLIAEGKIKKDKNESIIFRRDNSHYEKLNGIERCIDDEIPFDIPDNWCWSKLNICLDVRDGTHDTPRYVPDGIPLITSKNLTNGKIDFSTAKLISADDHKSICQRSKVDSGDILFAMIGSIGNPVLYEGNDEFSIKNMALFKRIHNGINMRFVYWWLFLSQFEMRKYASGGVQSFVSLSYLRNFFIPIPPLEEQERIVDKLEELLPTVKLL